MRGTSKSSRSAAFRFIGALQIFFALAATVGGAAHQAYTRHVACAEHGEWVEVGKAGAVVEASRATPLLGAIAEAAHGHDHCFIAPLRRDELNRTHRPALTGVTPQLSTSSGSRVAVPVAACIPILLLAPKSSPPV